MTQTLATATALALVLTLTALPATADLRRTPVVEAVEKASPAVVNIYTERVVSTPFRRPSPFTGDPFFDDFFSDFFGGMPSPRTGAKRTSLGSGVIIRADGTLITNEHVIVHASNIRVLMADKREFSATLAGADSDSDLAVLRVETDEPLPVVTMAADDRILIGETEIAIGNPYGLSHTVTTGVVSAVGRTIQAKDLVYHDFIQTDASINPGNSGGPLMNVEGRLIGINTAIHNDAEGIGFAIPIHRVRNIVEQILEHGGVQPPWVGIQVQNLTPEIAFHFGVGAGAGVLVSSVEETSPAAGAGLERGTIITRAQGEKIATAAGYARSTHGMAAGDRLRLRIRQNGEERDLVIKLSALPADRIDTFAWKAMGIKAVDAAGGDGVVVEDVRYRSPAHEIGIEKGDRISALGGREVDGGDAFRRRLASFRNSNSVLVSVVRGRRLYRVTLKLDRRF